MTAAQDEAWIQGSLARLETLEAQREQLAATRQTAALAEVEEEIRALYEVLESAAGEEHAAAQPMAPQPMGMAPAPMQMAPAPMQMAPAPMQMAPAPMGMAPSDDASDDDKPSRSALPFILVGVLVVGGGIAAFMALGGKNEQEAKPSAAEPAKVIKSGNIVEDTQEPVVAKGANADRTSGTKLKEPAAEERPDARRPTSGSSSSSVSRPRTEKKDDGRKIEVEKSRDPLAGID